MKKDLWMLLLMAMLSIGFAGISRAAPVVLQQGANGNLVPDYFNTANWAFSPPITKFGDGLPGLGAANANNLGQYMPVAIPDKVKFPGSDYYEISLVEYAEKMHTELPATKLRGYVQTNTTDRTVNKPHYLGPMIVATKDRPVRIKFTNLLPTGAAGNLFLPVDKSIMGAGAYEIDYDPLTRVPTPLNTGNFVENRATIHLHGGHTPWISDGTPHQWITPAGENTTYPTGVSVQNVPDMWFSPTTHAVVPEGTPGATNDPGPGSQTFYFTNQQSARLLFYHDHAWGITRAKVYAGEVAGYLITDPTETQLVNSGIIPNNQIPLIIQDKTFVDAATIGATDPTWNWGNWRARSWSQNARHWRFMVAARLYAGAESIQS